MISFQRFFSISACRYGRLAAEGPSFQEFSRATRRNTHGFEAERRGNLAALDLD
jgi:hypothetical protein